MTVGVLTQSMFASLRDALDQPIRSFAPGVLSTQGRISQRVIHPANTPPSVTGLFSTMTEWANDQQLTTLTGFQATVAGTIALTDLGVRMANGGGLQANPNYIIGLGHYWEEGILLVEGPVLAGVETRLGSDPGQFHRGRLVISLEGGAPRFVWVQADTAGTGITRHVFTNVPVPLSPTGPGQVRRPIYYRFIRNLPPGGAGKLQLRAWAAGAAYVQQIDGIDVPNAVSSASPRLGATPGGGPASVVLPWWRAQGTETYPGSATFGFDDYWTTPLVFDDVQYVSHGDFPGGFLDSQIQDRYWHSLSVSTVVSRGGGVVRLRVAGTNTLPGGSSAGLFSGTPSPLASYPAAVDLDDEQGRYLALELEFLPGEEADLGLNEALLEGVFASAGEFGVFEHGPLPNDPPEAGTIEVTLAGEGAATGSLPFAPNYPVRVRERRRTHRGQTELGYVIGRPLGTKGRRWFDLHWMVPTSGKATMIAALEAQGADTFVIVPPRAPPGVFANVALTGRWTERNVPPAGVEIEAEVVEVFP